VSDLFLADISGMRVKGVIERFPVDVEGVRRQVTLQSRGKIIV